MNCSLGSVVVIDGPQRTDCPRLNDILNQMQRNLDAIAAQRDAVSLRAHDGSQPSPCAPGQPAIRGVSQYDDPDNANILNLAPHAGGKPEQWRFDKGGAGGAGTTFSEPPPTQTHAAADPASSIVTVGNARSSVPGNLASGAPGVARPMTEKQRNVRVVGPQFLPDPSTSIDFDKH